MRDDLIVVFGGSGFLGRHVVRALAKREKRVRVAMRRPHLGLDLKIVAPVGQVQLMQANVRYPDSIPAALEGADAVVNLVGVLNENGQQNFETLNVDAARAIAEAAAAKGIKRVVHVSALGAAQPKFLKPVSRYQRTKFRGEEVVREAAPDAVILRPAPMFGPDDSFLNRLASMARMASYTLPLLPLVGGKTKMQPMFAGDVARAIAAALDEPRARGRTFELGGPHIYTVRQIFDYVRTETHRKPALLPLPFLIAQPVGLITEWLYKLPLLGEPPSFADLGITQLESIEAIAPSYLWRYRPYGQFQTNETA